MIYKNDTIDVKILPYVRIFFIAFGIFLTFYLGKSLLQVSDDIIDILLGMFVPIMFLIVLLFEACITKYINSIEVNSKFVNVKYGNGYVNKTLLINKQDIVSFNVDIITVNRWYYTKGCSRYITFDTIINIYLKNGNKFSLRDNHSGIELTKLLYSVQKKIPNFKFESTIHDRQDSDIIRQLKPVLKYYDGLLKGV